MRPYFKDEPEVGAFAVSFALNGYKMDFTIRKSHNRDIVRPFKSTDVCSLLSVARLDDEWYMVKLTVKNAIGLSGIKTYKCDQIGGVIDCLTDNRCSTYNSERISESSIQEILYYKVSPEWADNHTRLDISSDMPVIEKYIRSLDMVSRQVSPFRQ